MATHSSILAWRIPWTEEPGGLYSMGSQRVRHDWSSLAHPFITQHIFTKDSLSAFHSGRHWLCCGEQSSTISMNCSLVGKRDHHSVVSGSLWSHGLFLEWYKFIHLKFSVTVFSYIMHKTDGWVHTVRQLGSSRVEKEVKEIKSS